jgi:dihydrodipicolinate synthase/N-acetylneuraminate lyase
MSKSNRPDLSPIEYETRPAVRRGLSIPSITVLDEQGRIIETDQRRLFQYNAQEGKGADILFGVGTTGEFNRLSNPDRQRLIAILSEEVGKINRGLCVHKPNAVEGWAGVTAETKDLTLENIECAIDNHSDAVVIAPMSIGDLEDVVSFFHRDISDLFEKRGQYVPIFLYDNRDIAADPKRRHIKTVDVKRLSRLPFVFGIKVSAPRRVLGNYMRGASHYNDQGEFAIYIGNALLIFEVFHLESSLWGVVKEYWNRFLMHDSLPVGVVSGPANVLPREWRRAWHACYTGDEHLMRIYKEIFKDFEKAQQWSVREKPVEKAIACFKTALVLDGVIASDAVARGTPAFREEERRQFTELYHRIKEKIGRDCPPNWISQAVDDRGRNTARTEEKRKITGPVGDCR